jgi:hypothetical protein
MNKEYFIQNIVPLLNNDVQETINFLKTKGLLKDIMHCKHCGNLMTWTKSRSTIDGFRWKCMIKTCIKYKTTLSIRTGSCFDDVRCDIRRILFAIYLWSEETQEKQACQLTGLSRPTIITIYAFLRNICKKYFEANPIILGGEGIICQVDESLFTYKPKYHRGRAPQQKRWVFGIVDTSYVPAIGYMQFVSERNSNTLLPIIERVCLPGTIIVSDGWAAYPRIQERGYQFISVNHRENFVDPVTRVHTQHVESYWSKQKLRIKKMKGVAYNYKEDYLLEFLWRDRFSENAFEHILRHIR